MNGSNSQNYYLRRAAQATALAETATMPGVRAIHREMAARYLELADSAQARPIRPTLKLML